MTDNELLKHIQKQKIIIQVSVILNVTLETCIKALKADFINSHLPKKMAENEARKMVASMALGYFEKPSKQLEAGVSKSIKKKNDTPNWSGLSEFVNSNSPTALEVMTHYNCSIATTKRRLSAINAKAKKVPVNHLDFKKGNCYKYFLN